VREAEDDYETRHPGPSEIALVVEVADTSLINDRFKAEIYARAGIARYWIVNLDEDCIEEHSRPMPSESCYAEQRVLRGSDALEVWIDEVLVGATTAGRLLSLRAS